MSDALYNLRDQLRTGAEAIEEAHRNAISEVEEALDRLDEYENLFDDVYDARDAKDYHEEMSDIFDDVYDAQQAKDFSETCGYLGLDEGYEVEELVEELDKYRELGDYEEVRDAVHNSDGGVELENLKAELEKAEATIQKLIKLEDMRVRAIRELNGTTVEQAEIDQRAAEEKAYECGLNDGLIVRKEIADGAVDVDLTEDTDGDSA